MLLEEYVVGGLGYEYEREIWWRVVSWLLRGIIDEIFRDIRLLEIRKFIG